MDSALLNMEKMIKLYLIILTNKYNKCSIDNTNGNHLSQHKQRNYKNKNKK